MSFLCHKKIQGKRVCHDEHNFGLFPWLFHFNQTRKNSSKDTNKNDSSSVDHGFPSSAQSSGQTDRRAHMNSIDTIAHSKEGKKRGHRHVLHLDKVRKLRCGRTVQGPCADKSWVFFKAKADAHASAKRKCYAVNTITHMEENGRLPRWPYPTTGYRRLAAT